MRFVLPLCLGLLALVVLAGCSDSNIDRTALPVSRTVQVSVYDVTSTGTVGSLLTGAQVSLTPANGTVTMRNGVATITVLADGTYTLTITASGHVPVTKTVVVAVPKNTNGFSQSLTCNLVRKAEPVAVAVAQVGGQAVVQQTTVVQSAVAGETTPAAELPTLTIPANSALTVNGVAPTAPVEVTVTPVPVVAAAPVAVPATGGTIGAESLAVASIDLEPAGLASTQPMTLSIPIASLGFDAAFATQYSPFTLKRVDASGQQTQAGTATYNPATGCLEATLSSFRSGTTTINNQPLIASRLIVSLQNTAQVSYEFYGQHNVVAYQYRGNLAGETIYVGFTDVLPPTTLYLGPFGSGTPTRQTLVRTLTQSLGVPSNRIYISDDLAFTAGDRATHDFYGWTGNVAPVDENFLGLRVTLEGKPGKTGTITVFRKAAYVRMTENGVVTEIGEYYYADYSFEKMYTDTATGNTGLVGGG
jgi:hypothetical protein